jgi:hypothetical protein
MSPRSRAPVPLVAADLQSPVDDIPQRCASTRTAGRSRVSVDLPDRSCPVVIVTWNRALNPVVDRFIAHMRDFTPSPDHR